MSLVGAIKDYVESSSNGTFQNFLGSVHYTILYFFTGQCFKDITFFSIYVPELTSKIVREISLWDSPGTDFILAENQDTFSSTFWTGFFNSLFLALPLSVSNWINTRRLLIQGIPAGIAGNIGSILADITIIGCVMYGIRPVIFSWFNWSPWTFILGLILVVSVLYEMTHEKNIRTIRQTESSRLFKISSTSFLIAWTQQATILPYLKDVGVHIPFSNNLYLIGLLFGHIIWTTLYVLIVILLSNLWMQWSPLPYTVWIKKLNFLILSGIAALSISSIPYYAMDYVFTSGLGFVPDDVALANTVFSHSLEKRRSDLIVNPIMWDRGVFEENMGYQGEAAWDQVERRLLRKKKNVLSQWLQKLSSETSDIIVKDSPKVTKTIQNFLEEISLNDNKKYSSSVIPVRTDTLSVDPQFFVRQLKEEDRTDFRIQKANRFKSTYYTNPIYTSLLKFDIDQFLQGQPTKYILQPKEEKDLWERRHALFRYHNTMRKYKQNEWVYEYINKSFQGSKSLSDRPIHQQYKGTLKVLRRLFHITLNRQQNPYQLRVLSYDQPLYNDKSFSVQHEEIEPITDIPFLQNANLHPLYFGWDEKLRQVVLTTRTLSKEDTMFTFQSPDNQIYSDKLEPLQNLEKFKTRNSLYEFLSSPKAIRQEFTAWPRKVLDRDFQWIGIQNGGLNWLGTDNLKFR